MTRSFRFACLLFAGLALPAAASAEPASRADPEKGREWLRAWIAGSAGIGEALAHSPRRVQSFALVPGSGGRQIEIATGPAVACWEDNEEYKRRYNKIADEFPVLRIRFDPAKDRFEAPGQGKLAEAQRRTEAEAIALAGLCEVEEDERPELMEELRTKLRAPTDFNDDNWYTHLRPIFLGIEATGGLKDWRPRRRDVPCLDILGERLWKLFPFPSRGVCTFSVGGPDDWDEPGTIGSISVVSGKLGPGRSEFGVTFSRVEELR